MVDAFLHGFILAIGLILPLGAQNVFIFNQGATQTSFLRTLPVVVTAGLCDTLLIVIAVLGLSVIVFAIPWLSTVIYMIGFLFLLYMGVQVWKSSSAINGSKQERTVWHQVTFALSASLLNPHALLDTIGVIGTGSLIYQGGARWSYTVACVLVSWLWFFFLAILGKVLKGLDAEGRVIRLLNQISALIIWGVACYFGFLIIKTFI